MPENRPTPSMRSAANAALCLLFLASLALAGCSQPTAPSAPSPSLSSSSSSSEPRVGRASPQADDPPPAVPPTMVEQRVDLSGVILLRPAGPPIAYTGDSPAFSIEVPPGTQSIVAHAEWLPDQIMGLEFHPPGDFAGDHANRSWPKQSHPNLQVTPPIDLTVGYPEPGEWWCYFGPSTVGGGAAWNMTLRFTLPEGSQVVLAPSA